MFSCVGRGLNVGGMVEKKVFTNDLAEISRLNNWVEGFAQTYELGKDNGYRLMLVMEELVSNVIKYAFTDAGPHEFEVTLDRAQELVRFSIHDHGRLFDPTAFYAQHVVSAKIEDRPVGGLGVHLVKQYCQDLVYQRDADGNHLSGCIRFSPSAA